MEKEEGFMMRKKRRRGRVGGDRGLVRWRKKRAVRG